MKTLDHKSWLEAGNSADAAEFQAWLEDYQPVFGGALESNINGLWFAKQTAKGSAVTFTTGTKRGRWVGGDLQTNRVDGEENWSDQTLFADTVDFANTLTGAGAPVLQGQSSLIAYLCWLSMGQETVTGGVSATVVLTPGGTITAGTFTITFTISGVAYTTAPITASATASAIATAVLAAIPQWPTGSVTGTGGPVTTGPVTLTFTGVLAAQPIPLPTLGTASLTGTSPTLTASSGVTGTPFQHVLTPADTGGFWYGVFKSVGKSVVARHQYNDCRTQSLRLEGSSASKVVKVTPTLISLDPGRYQTAAADPTKLDDGLRPFIYTEAQGTFNIDGAVYSGQSAFAVMFTWGLNEYYGDDVVPFDLINNVATATLEGLTLLIDAAGLSRYNTQIYGTPTPTAGMAPLKGIPAMGSYSCLFTRTNPLTGLASESFKIEMYGVKWAPTLAIPANPAGGAVELSFTGGMRKTSGGQYAGQTGNPPFKVTIQNPLDPAFTV